MIAIAGGICLVVLAVSLWLEWRREDRSRRALRVAAVILAVAGLAGMVIPLRYQRVVKGSGQAEALYLTEGYDKDSVRRFLTEHPAIREVRIAPEAPAGGNWAVSRLHVFGYGLTAAEWAELRAPSLVFHPGAPVEGVTAVGWRRRLYRGEALEVQGHWAGRGLGPERGRGRVKLLLLGWAAALDSMVLDPAKAGGAGGDFELKAVPAQAGRAIYRLVAIEGADTVEREDIPVEVGDGRPLRVLVLASAPDFEQSFLLNWLAGDGQQAAVRMAVSRDRYQTSFIHMPSRSLDRLTPELLAEFDVVVADSPVLPGLRPGEGAALWREVREKGLGLIIRTDSGNISRAPGMLTLVRDSLSRPEVGVRLAGAGKVVLTGWNTTYVQKMGGQAAAYAAYWSGLLRRVARAGTGEGWEVRPAEPRVGQPVEIRLRTNAERPQAMVSAAGMQPVSVYLAQDRIFSSDWRGKYWPVAPGWALMSDMGRDTGWAYIWPEDGWAPLNRERRWRETTAVAGKAATFTEEGRVVTAPVPAWWSWLLFLSAVVFLWVERRIGGMSGKIIQ